MSKERAEQFEEQVAGLDTNADPSAARARTLAEQICWAESERGLVYAVAGAVVFLLAEHIKAKLKG